MSPWIWLTVIFLAVGVILLILFSHIENRIYFSRVKDNDHAVIHIRALYGWISYKWEVPIIKFKSLWQGISIKTEKINSNQSSVIADQDKDITLEKITEAYRKLKLLLANFFNFSEWFSKALSRVKCTELKWTSWIGLGDAANTAISTGVVWALKTSIIGYAVRYIKLDTVPRLNVVPQFNRTQFSTEAQCIVKIRTGYAMIAGLLFIAGILKVKGGVKAWQNTLFKAS